MSDGPSRLSHPLSRQVGLTLAAVAVAAAGYHLRVAPVACARRCRTMDLYRTAESLPSPRPPLPFSLTLPLSAGRKQSNQISSN